MEMSTEICWDKQMLMDLAPAPRFGLPGWSMLQSPVGESAIFHSPTSKVGAKPFRPSLLAGEVYERCAFAFTVMSCAQATPWLLAPTENVG